ncbi:flagellar hook-length control protein FliK [Enterococcus sp.]|jgi:flagellar hook-length control protein FliK|uniref:flagellar hook-length control protein FliK n=1 Tax=Enterococcus sp. TaxID=35783 RepID=UPI0025BF78B6|nr:flagellar hook-length control protein FliK [Enterococcus sp.]
MKQVAMTSAIATTAEQQQSVKVKDPGNFMQLLQQFSQEFEGNMTDEEAAMVPQGELDGGDLAEQVDSEESELVSESTGEESVATTEWVPQIDRQPSPALAGNLDWLHSMGALTETAKEMWLGETTPTQLLATDQVSVQPISVEPVSVQSVTGQLSGTNLVESMLQQEIASQDISFSSDLEGKGTTLPATVLEDQPSVLGDDQASLEIGTKPVLIEEPTVSASEKRDELQGSDVTKKQTSTEQSAETSTKSVAPQPLPGKMSLSEDVMIADLTTETGTDGLQQVATMDFSTLLTKANEKPTPTAIKAAVEPLAQKVEQLVQTPEKKITLQLVPEKLGKVRIALEVTAQGSRLEFTVEQQQTKHLLSSIKTELEQVLQKQEQQVISSKEGILKDNPTTSIERATFSQGSFAGFNSTSDGQTAQQGFSQPQRQSGKKIYNQVPVPTEEITEPTNHAISILA